MVNSLIPLTRMDDLLEGFFAPRVRGSFLADGRPVGHNPRSDILEGEKDYLIRIDLPGVDRKDLEINLENQTLTVKAERELPVPDGYQVRRRELPARLVFERTFNLGREIDADKISARLESGLLSVTLPKSETALPRRIDVA